MSREEELVKNTMVLSLGRFLPILITIITLPIITGLLTKAEYGTYDLIATLMMLLMPITTLQIQSAAFRFLIDHRGNQIKSAGIVTNIFAVTIPLSILGSVIIAIYFGSLAVPVRIAIGFYFFVDILYATISQIARGVGNNKVYAISSIILSCINAFGIIISLQIMRKGLLGVVVSLALANFIAAIYIGVTIKFGKYIKLNMLSKCTIKDMISYSWPMIPNNLSNWVLKLSDRLVIAVVLGSEANAVYAVANKIPNLLSIAQSVFVMAWQENASIAVNDQDADKYFSKMFDQIFSLLIGSTALLIAFTPLMFRILIRGDYNDAYIQMPLLIMGMFFYCISAFQGGIYIAHKKTKSVGVTTIMAAVVNFLVNISLINVIGITAGSLSTLVAYMLLYFFRMKDSLNFQPINYNLKKQILLFILLAIMLWLCVLQEFWINIINAIIAINAFLALNWELVKNILQKGIGYVKK